MAGFLAARWRAADLNSLEEWGLAGRKFGTLITWFLIGGDFYTAYTVIAVPAALYGVGAYGFFAIPYCILLYPYMMLVLPKLWGICHRNGYVTLADFVLGRYGSRSLSIAIALTGILATMPYIALQLVGMREVIAALGISGEWPLVAAFLILAAYTYTSGLRAPAAIAIVKDMMLYIMVLAAIIVIPAKLGGYGHIFSSAGAALKQHTPPGSLILPPSQYLSYSTLAFGSALAVVLYPHTITGVLSSASGRVIRRNAALLPAYNLLLALIALLGFMALAAGIHTANTSSVVPLLFVKMFPDWFAGFCLAAIGIGALVPAAIMSIASANLFTRNLLGEVLHRKMTNCGRGAQCQAGFDLHQAWRAGLCAVCEGAVCDRTAAARRHLDWAALPIRGLWRLHSLVLRQGALLGMGRRHGDRNGDGHRARFEELDLSVSYRRAYLRDVCRDSRAGGESAGFRLVDHRSPRRRAFGGFGLDRRNRGHPEHARSRANCLENDFAGTIFP